jgi:hypothetical protein
MSCACLYCYHCVGLFGAGSICTHVAGMCGSYPAVCLPVLCAAAPNTFSASQPVRLLGSGGFGEVYLCRWHSSDVAVSTGFAIGMRHASCTVRT